MIRDEVAFGARHRLPRRRHSTATALPRRCPAQRQPQLPRPLIRERW